jgi:MFS family permease
MFLTTIWRAKATSFHSVEAASILNAFFSAAGEALPAAVVSQLFFLHERGLWMGIYMGLISGGSAVGAIVSGFAITAWGWRWHFWVISYSF